MKRSASLNGGIRDDKTSAGRRRPLHQEIDPRLISVVRAVVRDEVMSHDRVSSGDELAHDCAFAGAWLPDRFRLAHGARARRSAAARGPRRREDLVEIVRPAFQGGASGGAPAEPAERGRRNLQRCQGRVSCPIEPAGEQLNPGGATVVAVRAPEACQGHESDGVDRIGGFGRGGAGDALAALGDFGAAMAALAAIVDSGGRGFGDGRGAGCGGRGVVFAGYQRDARAPIGGGDVVGLAELS